MNHDAVFQSVLQTVSQKGDQHMRIGTVLELMIDGPDAEFTLQRTSVAHNTPTARPGLRPSDCGATDNAITLLRGVQFLFVPETRTPLS